MHRHAFLIMAHNNWYTLERLMLLLDAPWADIYLHIDKKTRDFDKAKFMSLCRHASVILVRRKKVTWGTESQVKAEMHLFRTAYRNGPYWYYHLMSGTDLPLKPIGEIYSFFENTQDIFLKTETFDGHEVRFQTYLNIFRDFWLPKRVKNRLNWEANKLQKKLKINRMVWLKTHYPRLAKGHNWCDLTQPAVKALIDARKDIRRFTRFTRNSDESYKQIVILNNQELSGLVSDIDIWKIDWTENGFHPRTYTPDDYQELISAKDAIFARKFDDIISRECIDKIYDRNGAK